MKEGQPPSLAGGVRDTISGLDIKGQVELARARNWGKVFWQSPGSVTGKSKPTSETEALDAEDGRGWEWLRVWADYLTSSPALPLAGYVTCSKVVHLSEPNFLIRQLGIIITLTL